ncbi:MAG: hypothetical protein HY909_14690 [Deltaproteobacteria bacterium]|nr:hypothetical protein [Deltaproteobacteria bacterium]
MGSRRKRAALDATVTTDALLRAEPAAVARLAASELATWRRVMDIVRPGQTACPAALVHALLAFDDVEGWQRRSCAAFSGRPPDDGAEAWYDFARWLGDGILAHLPPTDPTTLRTRYKRMLEDLAPGAAERVEALTRAIASAGDTAAHRALLGRALLLLAQRRGEAGDQDAAIAAATRAEDVFTKLGEARWAGDAKRQQASALLRQRKLDEAIALVDAIETSPGAWRGEGASVPDVVVSDSVDALYWRAALLCSDANKQDRTWRREFAWLADRIRRPNAFYADSGDRPDVD